ncbi:NUDIX hydrolase [Kovacikia minuta CCNUW1]|uniref:NUDIX hydrolase n=1 Tax=Kovacikia minuta TaxID=2931930 RepID=UPI001CC91339|nr:NUDIX hydrolase [Kovacikia minuta]UBF28454.1 NUDIX hydrolase [Kovacikia minuta CCNUW1]
MEIVDRNTVFSTPWFDVIAKLTSADSQGSPYYSLQLSDYVSVLAVTEHDEFLLVRQYRPSVEAYTLELPSGHLEAGELPDETAQRELLEETGYEANTMELLGCLIPDTGRLSNRLWCYFAGNVRLTDPDFALEPGIELLVCNQSNLMRYILEQRFNHALHIAPILLAILKGKVTGFGAG